jgi:ubiquinone/menaquinone biosynthesis C-methylase UbiE
MGLCMSYVAELVSDVSYKIGHATKRVVLRAGRRFAQANEIRPGFFDQYPQFFETSETTAFANRLNERHRAIIDANRDAISGKRVLDIASHDGRWSFAALKAGAAHITGLEAREHLIKAATENLRDFGSDRFQFIQGDAYKALAQLEPGSIDTIMCLGFFYHVTEHMTLLSLIERLKPQHIIIDTGVAADARSVVVWQVENHEFESDAFKTANVQKAVLAGVPSKPALDMMLTSLGWKPRYYDWKNVGIRNWAHIDDYQEDYRVTLRVDANR